MTGILMAVNAPVFGSSGRIQNLAVSLSRSLAACLDEQAVVAVHTSFVGHAGQYLFGFFLPVVFAPEVVHIDIFTSAVRFGDNVGKEVVFRRQMAIHALYSESVSIAAVW